MSSTNIFGITIVSFSVCEVSTKTFLKQNCVSVVEYFVGSCMGFVKIFNMDNFCNSFGKLTIEPWFPWFHPLYSSCDFPTTQNQDGALSPLSPSSIPLKENLQPTNQLLYVNTVNQWHFSSLVGII